MYAPFFALGYKVAINQDSPRTGFSEPFATCIRWGSIFYVIVGLCYLRLLLLHYFSERVTALALFGVLFGTMLFLYTFIQSETAHGYLFACMCAFLYYVKRWYDSGRMRHAVALGIVGGLTVLIRPVEILIFFLFLMWEVRSFADFKIRLKHYQNQWFQLLTMALICFAWWIPQMFYWKAMTGHYIFFSYQGESFFWSDPQIMNILFSYKKGWLLYTPLVVLPLLGIFCTRRELPLSRFTLVVMTAVCIYVFSCWWDWGYGGCFGNRAFCQHISWLSLPLASFIQFIFYSEKKFVFKGWLALLSAVFFFSCVWLNIGQSYQYQVQRKIHHAAMTKTTYWDVFRTFQFNINQDYKYWGDIREPDYKSWSKGIGRDE
jgi:hypothetical protein